MNQTHLLPLGVLNNAALSLPQDDHVLCLQRAEGLIEGGRERFMGMIWAAVRRHLAMGITHRKIDNLTREDFI